MNVKEMNMSEVIAYHNELAEKLGVATQDSFKTLGAARMAAINLEAKVNTVVNPVEPTPPETTATPEAPQVAAAGGEEKKEPNQKYNSSGRRGPNQGIGAYAKERIIAGKTNTEILAEITEKFPGAKTSSSCIAFYRTALKKGAPTKSPEQLRAEAQALLDKANAVEVAAKAKAEADAAQLAAQLAAAQAALVAQQAPVAQPA